MPLFPLPGRPVPHPALGDRKVWPAAPPAAPTDEANATPASPRAVAAAPLGAGPPTSPQPAMLPAVPTTPAAGLSLDMAQPSSSVTATELLPVSTRPASACPRLGGQGGRLPCSPPALFPVPDIHGATTGWETSPHHYRSVASQSLHSRSAVPPGQPFHSCPGSPPASPHGGYRHFGGVHSHSHPSQSSSLPCLFLPQPTVLFSSFPLRSQCGTVHIHQGPGLATPHPSHPEDQYPRLSRRYCPLSPLSSNPSPACRSHPRETLSHGFPGQSPEVATRATNNSPMAGHPMAPTDGTLAGVPKQPGQNPVVYPPAPSRRPHHPQASGGSGGSDQLCLSGAQPFESLPLTADSQNVPGLSPRERHLSTHSPTSPPCPAILGGSQYLGQCPSLSGHSAPSRPLDGRFPHRVGSTPPPSGHCPRPLGAAGGSPPYQCSGASGGPPSHLGLPPVVLSPRCVHSQRDGSVRSHAPPHSLSSVARGAEKSVARLDRTAGVSPSAPHSHHPQCGSGRSQPPQTSQYRVGAASRGVLGDSSLGRSSSGGPPGLTDQSPSAAVGVSLPSPGCSGLQLSQYRLERLRQHLRVPSSRSDPDSAATHPWLQRSPRPGGSMGPSGSMVAPSPPSGQRSPPSADNPVPVLRPRPGLPQVGDLRSLDRLSFLWRALLASHPVAVVGPLLASTCPTFLNMVFGLLLIPFYITI